MRSIGRAFWFSLPLIVAACGAEKSPPSSIETKVAALGETISTDQTSYQSGATITVTYAGLPGNQQDWIGIAPAGSPAEGYVAYVYTNGQTSGTATFTAPAAGTYVARAHLNNGAALLAESAPFTVVPPPIATDRSSYTSGSTITVTYSGLPGNAQDWIAIAAAGSDTMNFVAYVYTNGQTSGTATFTAPATGSYVARSFLDNGYMLFAESAAFTVTPGIATDSATYTVGATVTVTYGGLPGNFYDWIAISPAGSDNLTYLTYVYTNGQISGTATFTAPAAGSYVARAYSNNTFELLMESTPFTTASPPAISTDAASYAPGATVTVTYSGLPGNQKDWIGIAAAGSATTSFVAYVYTNGQTSGTATFTAPASGTFVARAFPNDTFNLLVESSPFTISATPAISTDAASYAPGATVTVTYSGLPGNQKDWIGISAAGSANTSFVSYVYTNGQTSGTATFTAPAFGTFVARAFPNDTFNLLVESSPFTIVVTPAVSTDAASYVAGATVTVTYSGLPGNQKDWVGIAAAGSANTSFVSYVYTNGQNSGTAQFVVSTPGVYVARSFTNDSFDLAAQSAVFTVCEAGMCFVASLSSAQEVPTNASTATGSGSFVYVPSTHTITYYVQHTVAGASAGHIHQAPPGRNAGVIVPFTLVGQTASGSDVLSDPEAADLLAGNLYTNIHSPTFPGGEIRGQILRPGELLFIAHLDGAQEVGPTGSTATGTGSVIFDPTTLGIKYVLQHNVVNATAAHIHQAPAGMIGSVIVPFTLVGNDASGTATLTAGQGTALVTGGLYMNVHSLAFSGGEIRGQLFPPGS